MKKIIIILMAAAIMTLFMNCRTKKTISNHVKIENETITEENNDTLNEQETISIVETKLNDGTIKKDITRNKKSISKKKKNKTGNKQTKDSLEEKNTTEMAKQKQQIKDLKEANKTLKKVATKKEGVLDKLGVLAEILKVAGLIAVLLWILNKRNR